MDKAELYEFELLKMASEKSKFAIALSYKSTPEQQLALERLQDKEWVKLIDVSPLAYGPPGVIFRVFKVQPEALNWYRARMKEMETMAGPVQGRA